MRRRPRRNHSPAFKAKVAIAAIKRERTIAQITEQFDVYPNQVTTWKAQLEGGAAEVFGAGMGKTQEPPVDVKALHARSANKAHDPRIEQHEASRRRCAASAR